MTGHNGYLAFLMNWDPFYRLLQKVNSKITLFLLMLHCFGGLSVTLAFVS